MSRRALWSLAAAFLTLSLALNCRALQSLRLDMDSLNAMAVFYLGRVGLVPMLRWLASSAGVFSSYEPVTNLSYWLIYGFLGAEGPSGFRLWAVLLQAADAVLVAAVAARWVKQGRWAVLAGLVYLLHPMHENWTCMGIPHYLATFFVLCGLWIHGLPREGGAAKRTAALGAAFLLAALSKESGALLPLLLLCWDAAAWAGDGYPAGFWRRRLVPYLGLGVAALFYAWLRWDLVQPGLRPGDAAIDAGQRLWQALGASRYAAALPAALVLALLALRRGSPPFWTRAAFCAAWFVVGLLPFLGLLPFKLPEHVQGIDARYLFLPMAGLAWLLALVLDLCAQAWGRAWVLVLAVAALAPLVPGLKRLSPQRQAELSSIARGLGQCAGPVRPNWDFLQAAIALPLVRRKAPVAFEELARTPGLGQSFVTLFAQLPFDGADPKWRCLAQTALEQGDLEACVAADKAFAAGGRELEAGRYGAAAAAFEAAARAWPSFTEGLFQRARALSLSGDAGGAARSYERALRTPMAAYLLGGMSRRLCAGAQDESCRFLERTALQQEIDRWRATRQAWLGAPPPGRIAVPLARLRRWAQSSPQDLDLWLDLASVAAAQGDSAAVREALSPAEALASSRESWERIARLYQGAQDSGAAIRILDRLVKDHPADPRCWNDRAVARLMLKDEAAAVRDLERALAMDPDFLPAYLTMGGVRVSQGRKDKALELYEKALQRPVKRGEPPQIRRMIQEERDKIAAGRADLGRILAQ